MICKELINLLSKFPSDKEVSYLCPDGYKDGIGEIHLDNDEIEIVSEYLTIQRKNHDTSKL